LSSYFESPNLFIVGDEKQAIYRFQGASLENFLYFKNKFPTAQMIRLDENYRSHQSILDVSHALAEPLPGDKSQRPRLLSKGGGTKGAIDIISYQTEVDESVGLASLIEQEINNGRPPKEIAVLVRTNKEITDIGRILRDAALLVTLFQDEDVLNDPDVAKLFLLLRSVNDPSNDTLLAETLFIDFLELDPMKVIQVLHELKTNKKKVVEVIDAFPQFADNYKKWITLSKNASALEVVTSILTDSNLREHLLSETDSIEKMALLSTLYQEIATRQTHNKDVSLQVFLKDIDTLEEHGVKLSFASRLRKENTVSVMTAHKSKGLEWETVIIPHAVAGKWGSKRSMSDFRLPYPLGTTMQSGQEEDERRLFYVALTRAKERVVITHSNIGVDGRELVPTQFIEELPAELVTRSVGTEVGPSAPLMGALVKKVSRENTLWDEEYLKQTFLEQGLNATALNNYIECPWKYFFKNLVRVPEIMEKHQMYGTAIHFALSDMTNSLRMDKKFSEADLYKAFVSCLDKQPLTEKDYKEVKAKGKMVLEAFWKSEKDSWHKEALSEFNIPGVHLTLPTGEDILLRGRLDKVDLLGKEPASVAQEVCVVDFKTGRPKTRNEILGETKSATGNEKRQLDFYRLLLDLYNNGKYTMTGGSIVFTEPDEKGRIKKETFDIGPEDAEKIKELTTRVAEEILTLKFWDTECGDKDCEFCKLRKILVA
ncbi:MAG: UvrD/REP helicase, helicase / ATP-dependent helicase PcrA, partial [Parcubacteria group bacterium]|nr:UvrD/REP helicase, helicase / ATP-dependent helicase PcrA [Parcubacteria group bacterium]